MPKMELVSDLRLALRSYVKAPLVAVVTILSLGFGIGAAATVFTITNAILLRSPGIASPETVVGVATTQGDGDPYGDTSFPDYENIVEAVDAIESLAASQVDTVVFGERGSERALFVERVTANYFDTLGVTMARGRGFREDEARPERSERVVVLSHDLWQDHFGGEAHGARRARLSGALYTIVGVAPRGLASRDGGLLPDIWLPLGAPESSGFASRDLLDRTDRGYGVIGRLRETARRSRPCKRSWTCSRNVYTHSFRRRGKTIGVSRDGSRRSPNGTHASDRISVPCSQAHPFSC